MGGSGFFEWIVIGNHLISSIFDRNTLGYVDPVPACRPASWTHSVNSRRQVSQLYLQYVAKNLLYLQSLSRVCTSHKRRKSAQSSHKRFTKVRDPVRNSPTNCGRLRYLDPFLEQQSWHGKTTAAAQPRADGIARTEQTAAVVGPGMKL